MTWSNGITKCLPLHPRYIRLLLLSCCIPKHLALNISCQEAATTKLHYLPHHFVEHVGTLRRRIVGPVDFFGGALHPSVGRLFKYGIGLGKVWVHFVIHCIIHSLLHFQLLHQTVLRKVRCITYRALFIS